jgi:hypothetical protein
MKRIVTCCDGTWDTRDRRYRTNVAKVSDAVLPKGSDETLQKVFYHAGVGTRSLLEKLPGGVFGAGLWKNVQEAYREIVDIYDADDELFFFGFSRGAYTARSTVGMIRKCGILRKDVEASERARLIKEAYDRYRNRKLPPDADAMKQFRHQHCVHFEDPQFPDVPPIKFVGVWDTVGALGIPLGLVGKIFNRRRYGFHDVSLSRKVKNAYHALAIDEKRGNFRSTLWEQHPEATNQKMEQRWFAGTHSDVGGGGPDLQQSDWTLRWMLGKARECGLECIETPDGSNGCGPISESRKGFWKWLPYLSRPIGRGVPPKEATYLGGLSHEGVDPAVIDRNVKDSKYMPLNLVVYFRENPSALEAAHKGRAGARAGATALGTAGALLGLGGLVIAVVVTVTALATGAWTTRRLGGLTGHGA